MLSRPLKIVLGISSCLAMLAAVIAVNTRRSWLPVTIDFGAPTSSSNQSYLPTAWRGNELWLLGGTAETVLNSGKAGPTPWRIARNWNRSPLPIVQKALRDNDVMALNPTNADFARSDGARLDLHLQIWRGQALTRHLKDFGHRNSLGLMNAERPTLFSFSPDGTRLIANYRFTGTAILMKPRRAFVLTARCCSMRSVENRSCVKVQSMDALPISRGRPIQRKWPPLLLMAGFSSWMVKVGSCV
jgi:hypothetical protein